MGISVLGIWALSPIREGGQTAAGGRRADRSAGEEVDRLRRRDLLDVLRLELKEHHALDELLLEIRIAELGGHDLAERDPAVGRDREPQHELALERGILAERTVVERVDRALVAVEDALDLLS